MSNSVLPRPWDSSGKNTGVGCHFLLQCMEVKKWKWSRSVVSDPQRSHGLQPSRLLHPWDFPGRSTGVGCHCHTWVLLFPKLCRSSILKLLLDDLVFMAWQFISFYHWIFHHLDVSQFIYSPIEGHPGCFQVLENLNKAAIHIMCKFLCGQKFSVLVGEVPMNTFTESHGEKVLAACKVTAILNFHLQWMRFPVAPHPCQYLVLCIVSVLDFGHSNRCVVVLFFFWSSYFSKT